MSKSSCSSTHSSESLPIIPRHIYSQQFSYFSYMNFSFRRQMREGCCLLLLLICAAGFAQAFGIFSRPNPFSSHIRLPPKKYGALKLCPPGESSLSLILKTACRGLFFHRCLQLDLSHEETSFRRRVDGP